MGNGPQQPQLEQVSILLVDDKPQNLLALEAILEQPGYRLVKAQSGEEALRALLHTDFAVVLLDLLMPEMDGLQVVHLMKQRAPSKETVVSPWSQDTAAGGNRVG